MADPTTEVRPLAGSGVDIRQAGVRITAEWLASLVEAPGRNRPTAYTMVMGSCVEILQAFGFTVAFPEITALQGAVRKAAPALLASAENYGYSPDICNYVKSDVGLLLAKLEHPVLGRLNRPSLVITSNLCTVYTKWAEIYQRMLGAQVFVLDVPQQRSAGRPSGPGSPEWEADLGWVEAQLRDLIRRCEEITGTAFDPAQLAAVEERVNEMIALWKDILALNHNRPAPYDFLLDGTVFMGVMNALRGTPEGVAYFHQVRDELQRRVSDAQGSPSNQRFRLVFSGVPHWPRLREMISLFRDRGAVFVAADYSTFACGGLDLADAAYDPSRPMESLAEVTLLAAQRGCSTLLHPHQLLGQMIDRYQADGLVFHAVKSCRTYSTSVVDVRAHLGERPDAVPSLFLESDHMDERYWSPAQVRNRVEAFFEVLEKRALSRKGAGEE